MPKFCVSFPTRAIWQALDGGGIVADMSVATPSVTARLVPIAGPQMAPMELIPKAGGLLAGRQEQCDLRLTADTVSRAHARFLCDSGRWRLIDLKSRWG